MAKQTKMEKAANKAIKALENIKRAVKELHEAAEILRPTKPPQGRLVMCEKCEEEMTAMPLERRAGERLYRCPKCRGEKWVKEE